MGISDGETAWVFYEHNAGAFRQPVCGLAAGWGGNRACSPELPSGPLLCQRNFTEWTSLLLIAAGQMGDPHFSYTWMILFVLTTFYAVGEITKDRTTAFLAIVFCFMSFFTFYKASPKNSWHVTKDTARDESMNQVIVERIAARAATNLGTRPAIVYSTFMGQVNAASQDWLAIKENVKATFRDLHRSGDIAEHLGAIRAADFVEVADSSSSWLARWLPSAPLQDVLLQNLRNQSIFRELPPVLGRKARFFFLRRDLTCDGR